MRVPGIDHVGSGSSPALPPSAVEQIFRDWRTGILPERDYHAMTAIWVAEHLADYEPKRLPGITHSLRDYCIHRLNEQIEADPQTGRKLGEWIRATIYVTEQNRGDCELMIWAIENLEAAGLQRFIPAIEVRRKVLEHSLQPSDELSAALRVQKIDSIDRMRRQRE